MTYPTKKHGTTGKNLHEVYWEEYLERKKMKQNLQHLNQMEYNWLQIELMRQSWVRAVVFRGPEEKKSFLKEFINKWVK